MKTIYLKHPDTSCQMFNYNNIDELAATLEKRGIWISPCAIIGDHVEIGDNAYIGDLVRIGDNALIGRAANIFEGAVIGKGVRIGDWAVVGDGLHIDRSLLLLSTRHSITYWGEDAICIGCQKHTISEWKRHYRLIGKMNKYTADQVDEYSALIDMIAFIHPAWNEYFLSHNPKKQLSDERK